MWLRCSRPCVVFFVGHPVCLSVILVGSHIHGFCRTFCSHADHMERTKCHQCRRGALFLFFSAQRGLFVLAALCHLVFLPVCGRRCASVAYTASCAPLFSCYKRGIGTMRRHPNSLCAMYCAYAAPHAGLVARRRLARGAKLFARLARVGLSRAYFYCLRRAGNAAVVRSTTGALRALRASSYPGGRISFGRDWPL